LRSIHASVVYQDIQPTNPIDTIGNLVKIGYIQLKWRNLRVFGKQNTRDIFDRFSIARAHINVRSASRERCG
jgi:hypothetical protein